MLVVRLEIGGGGEEEEEGHVSFTCWWTRKQNKLNRAFPPKGLSECNHCHLMILLFRRRETTVFQSAKAEFVECG